MNDLISKTDAIIALLSKGQKSRRYKLGEIWELNLEEIKDAINNMPSSDAVEVVRCRECIHFDPPHVENDGERIEYDELPKDAFDPLGTGFVNIGYGINVGGRCTIDYNIGYGVDKRVYRKESDYCSHGERR